MSDLICAGSTTVKLRVLDTFYGLFVNGALRKVIIWNHTGEPTFFDFETHFSSSEDYEVAQLEIRVQR